MLDSPIIDVKETGRNIDRLRKDAGMTVKEIQIDMGLTSPSTVYCWLYGLHVPSIDNLVFLAEVLGVTVDEILVVRHASDDRKGGIS